MALRQKKVLFVDDDLNLLDLIQHVLGRYAGENWEILTAPSVSEALGVMQQQKVDLLVIDIHMPVVDGVQFLNLLQRKYPNVLKVVLTGEPSQKLRAECLNSGAELVLEKPREEDGWQNIHSTLEQLTRFQPEEGFRGVLRRVGLQDVLQMECLARNSVILNIHTQESGGQVFVKEGQIVHAQCGDQTGEAAFNQLMGLKGGEFDMQPFREPPAQTIQGSWEFLLMEAARKRDESHETPSPAGGADCQSDSDSMTTEQLEPASALPPDVNLDALLLPDLFRRKVVPDLVPPAAEAPEVMDVLAEAPTETPAECLADASLVEVSSETTVEDPVPTEFFKKRDDVTPPPSLPPPPPAEVAPVVPRLTMAKDIVKTPVSLKPIKPVSLEAMRPQLEEMLVCTLQGEPLHEWRCSNIAGRVRFLEFLSQKTRQIAQGLPLGEFDRLEVNGVETRVLARLQPEWGLFVRFQRKAGAAMKGISGA